MVSSILENSPAKQAGLLPGDIILMIDGRSGRNLSIDNAAELIRGESGSQLTMTVRRRNGTEETLVLTREVVSLPTVRFNLQQQGSVRVGYIHLDEFGAHAAEQNERGDRNADRSRRRSLRFRLARQPQVA